MRPTRVCEGAALLGNKPQTTRGSGVVTLVGQLGTILGTERWDPRVGRGGWR